MPARRDTTFEVDAGTLTLRPDPDAPHAWLLDLDGTRQSHVDCDEPKRLVFDYVRRIGHVLDLLPPPGGPLDVVHLGGGGLTIPRYIAATRPGSRQRVFETDAALTAVVRRELPLPRGSGIRVRDIDALEGLRRLRPHCADVVICDVYADGQTPARFGTAEAVAAAARVLRDDGTYIGNFLDPLMARRQIAALRQHMPRVLALIQGSRAARARPGNTVVVGTRAELPLMRLHARLAADPTPGRVVTHDG